MLKPGLLASSSIRVSQDTLPRTFCRYKSITAAIERARQDPLDIRPARSSRRTDYATRDGVEGGRDRFRGAHNGDDLVVGRSARSRHDNEFRPRRGEDSFQRRREYNGDSFQRPRNSREDYDGSRTQPSGPESLPYTTAASEFIYGYSSVLAALKANRRQLYNLYVLPRGMNHEGKSGLLTRATYLNVSIHEVQDDYTHAFAKASSGRPHNGFILEASPLPVPKISSLGPCSVLRNEFQIKRTQQSREEAMVNGTQRIFSYKSNGWRYPLVVYADGVLDEGNLGAIARSAYFLGADAIITPTRQSAPWSHVAIKASAGAAEAMPIFSVARPYDFLVGSAEEGWRIYASDAIPPAPPSNSSKAGPVEEEEAGSRIVYTFARSSRRLPVDYSPVNEHPTILMMGAEDTGLRDSLLNAAHYKVGIGYGREDKVGVDSLNVSVAASLLCYQMLQKRPKPKDVLF